jgi:hypothetical protein
MVTIDDPEMAANMRSQDAGHRHAAWQPAA